MWPKKDYNNYKTIRKKPHSQGCREIRMRGKPKKKQKHNNPPPICGASTVPEHQIERSQSFSVRLVFQRSHLIDDQFLFALNVFQCRRQLHPRVDLLMAREAGGVNESFPTLRAFVELSRRVRLLVLLEVGQADEGLLAHVAGVALVAGVCVLVSGQAGGVAEALVTHTARVRPLFVRQTQPLLASFTVLVLLAQGVVVGLVAGAQLQADLEVRGLVERVFAVRVRVEKLSHVSHLVFGEAGGVAEDPVALSALVLLLSLAR